ncbi:transcriptional regulator, PadR family [Salinispora tropica CNB-440]|uniref:Transcriptional regulator, PadR family n=1 Tax=Salinispora tropica (strain ATCC BAA-916 / DSM 44818 / JCM 13857 / NBRC 105044 / CNB-440) TaxID=369723 RepID=A4X2J5_SALTO|nr:transcriptional regulator, PadR family [Salinispora tropica CNB-440]
MAHCSSEALGPLVERHKEETADVADDRRESALPSTAYAVLGLLTMTGEVTGYELRKWAMNMRYFYWSPAQSQLYLELRRLRDRALVYERTEAQPGRPDKRYYTITDTGRRVFRDWLDHSEVGPPLLKHSVALRLFFGHQTSHSRLREVLTQYAEWARRQQQELSALKGDMLPALRYSSIVADWGVGYFAAEINAVESALASLDAMDSEVGES